ncbi:hypothetical protein GCM10010441_43400 [Kitasatospora paracochleata]|uniref:DUF4190 domain-containing protein n=1 Tax=Kitasatospora paracochleata TaxID=58354 RepID=A0ABT1J1B5_9ACTN|nr:DUF4190 domain-containing protein [Kitasatospora paracochleata]MCP2310876.1 hypothetical protein [Kitasatospora paracochleata]
MNEATPDAGAAPEGYPAHVQEKRSNGFAVASLVFGLIGGPVPGISFGIAGLNRAKKVGEGRVMSWVGIALSVLWLIPVAYLAPHLLKASNAGCISANDTVAMYGREKLTADKDDPNAFKADLQALVSGLDAAAVKGGESDAGSAIQKVADDFRELDKAYESRTKPSPDLDTRLDADAAKLDSACGAIGS